MALVVVHNLVHSPIPALVLRISDHGGVMLIPKKQTPLAEPLCKRNGERSNMQLSTKPESAQLVWITDGDDDFPVIILDCVPDPTVAVLEIGDGHVFASKANRSLFNRRQACNLRVRLQRKTTLKRESVKKLNLSESKIGELVFCPASEAGDFHPASPAALDATLFVSDELHGRLLDAFQAGKRASLLTMEIEKQEVLKFGWEPDGSRKVWKLESATEPSTVDVGSFGITIELFG